MKAKNHPLLSITRVSLAAAICMACSASAASNSWNTTTGTWDTTATNWASPTTWTNGDDAVFSNTATASIITLSSGLTAGSVMVGNGTNNAKYTFTGSGLSATSFTVQGTGSNDLSTPPPATVFNDASITLSGNLSVGRAFLNITGNSTVSADTIGSPAGGDGTGAWGVLTIADTASVTATNGFSVGTTAWGLNLNGGTLTTKNLSYSPHSYSGTTNLNFNGTLIKANQNNASFIGVGPGGLDSGFNPSIGAGGAKFDSNGYTIGIGVALQGSGALTKSGTGTLNLNVANSYSGGTVVNGGTLSLNHEPIGIVNTAIGAMTSSNTVTINNGGTLTGTKNNWLSNTGLASGGGNAISVVVNQGGTLKGGSGTVTGLGNVTLSGGTIEVTNGLGDYGWNASFTLGGDITVSGSTASAITTSSGAGSTANIYLSNGSNGTGGTRTFTVNDVTSSAASDLVVSAQLAKGTVIKAGAGTLELAAGATGTETAVSWQVNNGTLLVNSTDAANTGAVSVNNSGTVLKGTGKIGGATTVNAGAIHAPGSSVGKQEFASALTYADDSIFSWEIDKTNPAGQTRGTDYDAVNVTGTLAGLDGVDAGTTTDAFFRIVIGDSDFSDTFWNATRIWGDIFTAADGTTDKTNWASIFTAGFQYYKTDGTMLATPTVEGSFSFVESGTSLQWTAVPEPTSALVGLLLGLGLLRRRKK